MPNPCHYQNYDRSVLSPARFWMLFTNTKPPNPKAARRHSPTSPRCPSPRDARHLLTPNLKHHRLLITEFIGEYSPFILTLTRSMIGPCYPSLGLRSEGCSSQTPNPHPKPPNPKAARRHSRTSPRSPFPGEPRHPRQAPSPTPSTLHPHPHPHTLDPTPSTLHPQPYTLNPTPSTLHPQHYTLNPTPSTLHPKPYTLNTTPSTLNPKPYTLNPTPLALHPKPYTLSQQEGEVAIAVAPPAALSYPEKRELEGIYINLYVKPAERSHFTRSALHVPR